MDVKTLQVLIEAAISHGGKVVRAIYTLMIFIATTIIFFLTKYNDVVSKQNETTESLIQINKYGSDNFVNYRERQRILDEGQNQAIERLKTLFEVKMK